MDDRTVDAERWAGSRWMITGSTVLHNMDQAPAIMIMAVAAETPQYATGLDLRCSSYSCSQRSEDIFKSFDVIMQEHKQTKPSEDLPMCPVDCMSGGNRTKESKT